MSYIHLEPIGMVCAAASWVGGHQLEQERQPYRERTDKLVPTRHEVD